LGPTLQQPSLKTKTECMQTPPMKTVKPTVKSFKLHFSFSLFFFFLVFFFSLIENYLISIHVFPILNPLSEKAMAPHSSTLAWKIPWMEEPGGLQSMGSWRVGHDWATSLSLFTFLHWRRKWQPTPVFWPGESQGWGSLVGCHLWVAQSQTRLKRLSSSSSSRILDLSFVSFSCVYFFFS